MRTQEERRLVGDVLIFVLVAAVVIAVLVLWPQEVKCFLEDHAISVSIVFAVGTLAGFGFGLAVWYRNRVK